MIDTHLDGSPDDLRAVAAYLSEVLAAGVTTLADTVVAQRSTLRAGWRGEAGAAFLDRATVLAACGDEVGAAVAAMGGRLAGLASVLSGVQIGLAGVRAEAHAAGLEVQDRWILHPPAIDAETTATYAAARERCEQLRARWDDALTDAAAFAEANATSLGQATLTLLVSAYTAALTGRLVPIMHAQSLFKVAESERLLGYGDDLAEAVRSGRLSPFATFYRDYDDFVSRGLEAADEALAARELAARPRLPTGLARGLALVGPAAAAYGVYDDLRHGESVEQAVVSQGGGLVAGIVAGAAGGAVVGTMTSPVIGTVGGGVIGAVAGYQAGKHIDEHYEREAAAEAEQERRSDLERVRQLLNLSEGLPLFATPGSDGPDPFGGRP